MCSCLRSIQPNCLKNEVNSFCSNKKELTITKVALAVIALVSAAAFGTGIALAGFHLYLLVGVFTAVVATAVSCYIQYRQNNILEVEQAPNEELSDDTLSQISDNEPLEDSFFPISDTDEVPIDSSSASSEEIPVLDNGDCLFDAFALLSQVYNSSALNGLSERQLTVNWMRENYTNNHILQEHLQNSIAEHYLAKIEKLEEEIVNLRYLNRPVDELNAEVESLEAVVASCLKNGFSTVKPLLEVYFSEMEKPGTFGGKAELYALSCRREVCVIIHSKDPTTNQIDTTPPISMNPEFTGKMPRHVTYDGKHYNPWVHIRF